MPRLSLYRPERGNDFKFIDKQIYEMFQVGGTDVYVHKYIGPVDPSDPNKAMGETTIQDVLFLENRDRKYDPDVFIIRGVYNVQDLDFNLSQFGLFLQNDVIFMTIHINHSVETIGRKIMSGDVFELPHLKEYYNNTTVPYALRKFYVVEDVTRAAEGFSATWYPHLYRLKLKPMMDSSEFKDIVNRPVDEENFAGDYECPKTYYPGQIIRYNGVLYEVTQEANCIEAPNSEYYRPLDPDEIQGSGQSEYDKLKAINDAVLAEAEAAAPLSGYDTRNFYTIQTDDKGNVDLITVDNDKVVIDDGNTTDANYVPPVKEGYSGYLLGDGVPPNGAPYGFGIRFPEAAADGDYFLRTDYLPNRLFRFNGVRWVKFEDKVRMTKTMTDNRSVQKSSFINNTEFTNFVRLYTDTFRVTQGRIFDIDENTLSYDIIANKVVTRINYDAKYGVEAFLNEQVMPITSIFEEGGKLAFIMREPVKYGDMIQWTIFNERTPQKVAISRALRPKADL